MKRQLFLLLSIVTFAVEVCAQGIGYDARIELGNGLYKVKSGEFYGIIDKNDNVIVSIEYQDIQFREGKALLTKNDYLYGVVDSLGIIKNFDPKYKVHPKYRYVYENYIIIGDLKWGFISVDGEPFKHQAKIPGVVPTFKKLPTMFDDVTPFVNGIATIYTKYGGWRHIDKAGRERYMLSNKKTKAIYRSSVHEGECVIVTYDGIKQYQENTNLQAVVKRILATTITPIDKIKDSLITKDIYQEGTLFIDNLNRVTKFKTKSDSLVFIEEPKPLNESIAITNIDTISLADDLIIELTSRSLQGNENGYAYTNIRLKNKSVYKFENLELSVSGGATKTWNGDLAGMTETKISLNIPSRFSEESVRRNIVVTVKYGGKVLEKKFTVTLLRYNPIRSR